MQVDELAEKLHTTKNALRVWCRRKAIELPEQLPADKVKIICLGYSVKNQNRKPETVQAARLILKQLENNEGKQRPEPMKHQQQHEKHEATTAETPKNAKQGRVFLMFVFVSVLVWQMFHTALLEDSVSPFAGAGGFVLSAVFAFGVQFTGLLLTIYKANKKFLLMYLVIDLVINLLVYFPSPAAAKVVLSVVAALAIYSYSELFTDETIK